MKKIVLVGSLDTKGREYAYLRDRLYDNGVDVIVIDAGVQDPVGIEADHSNQVVAELAGTSLTELRERGDRAEALNKMAAGAGVLLRRLHAEGHLDAVAGLGGTGGSTLVSAAMRELPVGTPKLLVSTVASGDTRAYVGNTDITMMNSIVDIAGINRISAKILNNAAAAAAGLAKRTEVPSSGHGRVIGATMFGLTTPCVTAAREYLEARGYEVLVFHATGAGGQALEGLIDAGLVDGMLDTTTTELADNLVGGVFSAGPDRLTAAGRRGIPQVVSVGAVDMVNFGPEDTVPERFSTRRFHRHNATVTLMRTTPSENELIGKEIASKVNAATGPSAVYFPLRGVSGIDVEGGSFFWPEADAALEKALSENLNPEIPLEVLDMTLNDPEFGVAMASRLHDLMQVAYPDIRERHS
ncbi:Tm-1-like ATP-binding domain-containing protein [Mycobacterium sp. 4D054]|uniref:Tm-1-like ATP-binding domain-containing protein n=1 Tax=unclassified Mycobacterium TaxID=2642494 RepID=UPI0021B3E8AE|nr:Tm-1-like ATP-binding domain-containing protein [Mycobacterium sp. SMC-8]UXA13524.1 Tm-1-like ATP-binding domain-containing protein [Mycobacterium sp. SMC-8]